MEPIESSETSAYNNTLTPGTYPKEKKLKSHEISTKCLILFCCIKYGKLKHTHTKTQTSTRVLVSPIHRNHRYLLYVSTFFHIQPLWEIKSVGVPHVISERFWICNIHVLSNGRITNSKFEHLYGLSIVVYLQVGYHTFPEGTEKSRDDSG